MTRQNTFRRQAVIRAIGVLIAAGALLTANHSQATETPAASPVPILSVLQCADNWLTSQGLVLGYNKRADGNSRIVARSEEQVQANIGSRSWESARQDAFNKARLQGLAEIARYFREGIESGATLDMFLSGGDNLPEEYRQAAEALSLSDRIMQLSSAKLDEEIRRYIPNWNLTDAPDEEKREQLVTLESRFVQRIKARAIAFLQGVTIGEQCEGPAEVDGTVTSGKYAVSVTVIWSPKLAYMAQAMFNPTIRMPEGNDRISLVDRFAAQTQENPDWMSTMLGARVWTDENGETVIVGFGAAPATSLKSADESKADLLARNYIAQFASATVESRRGIEGAALYQEFDTPDSGVFSDASKFELRVQELVPHKVLKGVFPVAAWRGKHPFSNTGMVVVARAWKPSAQTDADAAEQQLNPAIENAQNNGNATAIDTIVRSGVPVSVEDY